MSLFKTKGNNFYSDMQISLMHKIDFMPQIICINFINMRIINHGRKA